MLILFNRNTIDVKPNDVLHPQDMLSLARRNASQHSYTNVSFVESDITSTPLADGIADCVISNCVINLVPEKRKHMVFEDMFRLLRTGGRIAISDLLALRKLSNAIRSNVAAYVGCIAGAALVAQYEQWLSDAGFTGKCPLFGSRAELIIRGDVLLVNTRQDMNQYKSQKCSKADSPGCFEPGVSSAQEDLTSSMALEDYDLNDWIG